MPSNNTVHVAVAVIKNQHGEFFIAHRNKNAHQGSLWEFPGGKVEANETVLEALKRELFEEIGIILIQAIPLIRIHHNYHDKSVLLDVWSVNEFSGEAFGKEGQRITWISHNEFSLYDFPAANLPIINAVKLPHHYMITGEFKSEKELLTRVQSGLNRGIKLIQFRAYDLDEDVYFDYAKKIYALCAGQNAKLLLNTSGEYYSKYHAYTFSDGIHLNSNNIKLFSSDVLNENVLLSTSIHNQEELQFAEKMKVDFAVLSPINKTLSHPDSIPLGWEKFKLLAEKANIPVYALGGMIENDSNVARKHGGQGIAAISVFWNI